MSSASSIAAAFREASSHLSPPCQIPLLSTPDLIKSLESLRIEEESLDKERLTRSRKTPVGPGKPFSTKKIEDLKWVDLNPKGPLMCNQRAEGMVLMLRIKSLTPIRTVSVRFIAEDLKGRACCVSIFHVPPCDGQELADRFPFGSVIAIKEPTLSTGQNQLLNLLSVRVESPSDLELVVDPDHPMQVSVPTEGHNRIKSVHLLKLGGNNAFANRRYQKAFYIYSQAISTLGTNYTEYEMAARASPIHEAMETATVTVESGEDMRMTRLILLSNRAAAALKIQAPHQALSDCNSALSDVVSCCGSSHNRESYRLIEWKLVNRAAQAEYRLDRYEECLARLDGLIRKELSDQQVLTQEDQIEGGKTSTGFSTKSLEFQKFYSSVQERIQESKNGIYDWQRLWKLSAAAPNDTMSDVADYTHPFIKKVSIEGKGQGLITTGHIKRGDLLMVAKPLAFGNGHDYKRRSIVLGVNLYTDTLDSYSQYDLVSNLIEKARDAARVEGGAETFIDKLEALCPRNDTKRMVAGTCNTSQLEAIATFNGFHAESLSDKRNSHGNPSTAMAAFSSESKGSRNNAQDIDEVNGDVHLPSGLYYFSSFMNHSCIGTVTYSFLSDVIFIRARVDLSPDSQLEDSYVDAKLAYEDRQAIFKTHGFHCECSLCEWDQNEGMAARRSRQQTLGEMEHQYNLWNATQDSVKDRDTISRTKWKSFLSRIEATYAIGRLVKPESYSARRLYSKLLFTFAKADEKHHDPETVKEVILQEMMALRCLGVQTSPPLVVKSSAGGINLKRSLENSPLLGDTNAVLSCLFIAELWLLLGLEDLARNWVEIAKDIEKGQAGQELFFLRYQDTISLQGWSIPLDWLSS